MKVVCRLTVEVNLESFRFGIYINGKYLECLQ